MSACKGPYTWWKRLRASTISSWASPRRPKEMHEVKISSNASTPNTYFPDFPCLNGVWIVLLTCSDWLTHRQLLKFTIYLWAELLNIFNHLSVNNHMATLIYLHFIFTFLVNCQLITVGVIVAATVVFVDHFNNGNWILFSIDWLVMSVTDRLTNRPTNQLNIIIFYLTSLKTTLCSLKYGWCIICLQRIYYFVIREVTLHYFVN